MIDEGRPDDGSPSYFGDAKETDMDGKLVRLRACEKADLDAVMKWINDEEVTDLLGGEMLAYPVSSLVEEKFIEAGRRFIR